MNAPHIGRLLTTGGAFFYSTTLIVFVAGAFSVTFVRPRISAPFRDTDDDLARRCACGDGRWYRSIADQGYRHDVEGFSDTAFMPAYPVGARYVGKAIGVRTEWALLFLANVCLFFAFVLAAAYVALRFANGPPDVTDLSLLALGLMPATFFFRMAYAESMLLLVIVLSLYAIARGWPLVVVALVVGLATATRPVGVALLLPFVLYAWRRMMTRHVPEAGGAADADAERPQRVPLEGRRLRPLLSMVPLLLLACWGLIAFAVFQWLRFGDPFLFVKSQWNCRLTLAEDGSFPRSLLAPIAFEPVWATYLPSRPEYWARYETHQNPLLSLHFANPIYFVTTAILIVIGWRKKWLNEYELLLAAGLLLIPYLLKGHANAMASFARFSTVVFPVYPVVGHLLSRLDRALSIAIFAISTLFLAIYSALFTAGYYLF